VYSDIWSGYKTDTSFGTQDFKSVNAYFTLPQLHCISTMPPGLADTYASIWVGIGGVSAQKKTYSLPQVGVDANCINGEPTYEFWYEWFDPLLGNGSYAVPTPALSAGMTVQLSLSQDPKGYMDNGSGDTITPPGKWLASYAVNSNTVRSFFFGREVGSTSQVGQTAECILERPSYRDAQGTIRQRTLTNFEPIHFEWCNYEQASKMYDPLELSIPEGKAYKTGKNPTNIAVNRIVMQDASGPLAVPSLLPKTRPPVDVAQPFVIQRP
jgi:hypothetical protein